jgi:hypothetical protein
MYKETLPNAINTALIVPVVTIVGEIMENQY